ncbi:alpha/beta fold hydrolase [Neolewinella persica]|uniref:alpha/beta fold hydrolase n=1 Tax=Neolewinella persica TaxID=70998 RepID=UPI00146A02FB|nr:alpha/beta hydrolase [Neolewinella persica]
MHPTTDLQPVVWIHGLTGSVNFWEAAMYPEIKNQRSWHSISLPLHHPSTYSGKPNLAAIDENILAEIIQHAVDDLVPEGKFHLVGYSVGGFAAMNYAAKFPDRVASIISVGGFMTGRAKGIEGALQFFAKGTFFRKGIFHASYWMMQRHRAFFKLATLAYAHSWRSLLDYPQLDPTIRNIFPDVKQHEIAGQRAWFRYLLNMNLLDEICQIQHPVLVIAGDRDPVIPFRHQQRYANLLPNSQLVVLPDVGHVAFGEADEEFRTAVLNWLAAFDA